VTAVNHQRTNKLTELARLDLVCVGKILQKDTSLNTALMHQTNIPRIPPKRRPQAGWGGQLKTACYIA